VNEDNKGSLGPIEYSSEVTESTGDHHYAGNIPGTTTAPKEQTALSVIGLILALPFPIFVTILWVTLSVIKQQNQALGEGTMNAVFLYLLQFFLVPLLTISSIIIACVVTIKSKEIAKKIGYISFGVSAVGFVILGLFLNHS
jgi:fucose 4-O-acetylase-like acetyltransferase